MNVQLSVLLTLRHENGPKLDRWQLVDLVADALDDNLPTTLYLVGEDEDSETEFSIMDSTVRPVTA
jgi:hypothetical protein